MDIRESAISFFFGVLSFIFKKEAVHTIQIAGKNYTTSLSLSVITFPTLN